MNVNLLNKIQLAHIWNSIGVEEVGVFDGKPEQEGEDCGELGEGATPVPEHSGLQEPSGEVAFGVQGHAGSKSAWEIYYSWFTLSNHFVNLLVVTWVNHQYKSWVKNLISIYLCKHRGLMKSPCIFRLLTLKSTQAGRILSKEMWLSLVAW